MSTIVWRLTIIVLSGITHLNTSCNMFIFTRRGIWSRFDIQFLVVVRIVSWWLFKITNFSISLLSSCSLLESCLKQVTSDQDYKVTIWLDHVFQSINASAFTLSCGGAPSCWKYILLNINSSNSFKLFWRFSKIVSL